MDYINWKRKKKKFARVFSRFNIYIYTRAYVYILFVILVNIYILSQERENARVPCICYKREGKRARSPASLFRSGSLHSPKDQFTKVKQQQQQHRELKPFSIELKFVPDVTRSFPLRVFIFIHIIYVLFCMFTRFCIHICKKYI